MKKQILLAASAFVLLSAVPVFAGEWKQDGTGWYYQYDNGSYAKGGIVEIDGEKYGFDANGYMLTGWGNVYGEWHYFNEDGRMPKGWIQDGDKWYFINDDYTLKTSWYNDGKDTYYFYTEDDTRNIDGAVQGAMVLGTITIDGVTYYFNAEGKQDNMMASFVRDGITYRYRNGVLQWENINQKNDWIQYFTKEDLIFDVQEQLIDRYEGNYTYETSIEFEEKAREVLTKLLEDDPSELETFIQKSLKDYWGRRTRSSYYDDDDDD